MGITRTSTCRNNDGTRSASVEMQQLRHQIEQRTCRGLGYEA